jgi:hypothetical protein
MNLAEVQSLANPSLSWHTPTSNDGALILSWSLLQ